ncbi:MULTISPECIES: 2Fe-2S iron-sulfur cluster-binding protein [Bordetella]|uniref:2Fe-2S iron-sulfur cluster-binding protein n=1 Tax=Bordetella TaxID=517 RepID=UPI00045A3FB9|nr:MULTISPECIES: 2Fe-2S iron-sulfur cluster-binding protein [Bordetella]AOB25689.1 ferredoxin [Bordetella bronchiseptica]ARP78063.1 ferredoxin [Bordetella genomosp. 6]AZW42950.1 ferredoxin [Bordetella bronchiseptica]KCV65884.1 putative putidaredoxin [Bordetella bronchiseptica 99-R-0433]MBN3268383.1 ferredoxin [Bordetella bronchiseptica]
MNAIFITPAGETLRVEVAEGDSLMHAATFAGVPGILGECGGSCSCATCHVFVEQPALEALEPMGAAEAEALEWTAEPRRHNSRLCCQLRMSAALDGITVRVADTQN